MIQTVDVRRSQNPKFAVQSTGLILCNHELTMRQKSKDFWSMEDDNVGDQDPQDLDGSPQTDLHPIRKALDGHVGTVVLRWSIDMAALQTSGESYDVSLSIIQDEDVRLLGHYRHTDEGFGSLTSIRHETGLAILRVS